MAGVVAGGLFNAVAFAGAGFLFSKLNHSGYKDEIKRHNKAMEDLARAKEKWYENRLKNKEKIDQLHRQLLKADRDIDDTNKALDELREIQQVEYKGVTYTEEPKLGNFYKPSNEMKKYMEVFVAGVGLVGGYLIHTLI